MTQLKKTALVLGSILLTALVSFGFSQNLRLAHFMPPQHSMHGGVFVPLQEAIAEATDGEVTIEIFPAGALGAGPVQQFKRATDGTADITFGVHSYTQDLFPKSMLGIQVGQATNSVEVTERLWNIFDEYLVDEYKRVKVLGIWSVSPVAVISTKPIETVADLEGMKITSSGPFMTPFLEAWGAVPVPMGLPDIYNSLSTGVVDAVTIDASGIYPPWNFGEVAPYITYGIPGTLNPLFLVMDRQAWNDLSEEHQEALDNLTGRDFSIEAASVFLAQAQNAIAKAQEDSNMTIMEFSDEAKAAFFEIGQSVAEEYLTKWEDEGISDIRAAYEALNE